MDSILLLVAEAMVIAIVVWVIVTESKTPEQIGRILDAPPAPRKARFANLQATEGLGPRR